MCIKLTDQTTNEIHRAAQVLPVAQVSKKGKFGRPKNKDVRTGEYLTENEVDELMKAAVRVGRHGQRNRTMILIAFRHALRDLELVC